MTQRIKAAHSHQTHDLRRGNLAGSVTWLKNGTPLIETPASWLADDGVNQLFPVKSGEFSALDSMQCFALVDRSHRDLDRLVGSTIAVMTSFGDGSVELLQVRKYDSTYLIGIPGYKDFRIVRSHCDKEVSIIGKVLKILIESPTSSSEAL